jgi:hypothetical protein
VAESSSKRTQRVARDEDAVLGLPGRSRAALEAVDLLAQSRAQAVGIGMTQRMPDLGHCGEQRVRRSDQGIEAAEAGQVRAAAGRSSAGAYWAALAARRRENYGLLGLS